MSDSTLHTTDIRKRVGRNVFDTAPRISVVIPADDNTEFILETLDSVVGQKYREHEIILVNDGLRDTDSFERAIKMRLEDVVYIKQRNAGVGAALNTGVENARGQIIAFINSGDVWQSDFLASQLVFIERHAYDLVYCDADLLGTHSAYRQTFMETAPSAGEATFDSLIDLRCNVFTSGTMARKETIVGAGMFERERVQGYDFHLWLRMAKNGAKIGYQRKQLVKHRVRPERLTDPVERLESVRDTFERVRKTLDLTAAEQNKVSSRIAGLDADLAIAQGNAFLRTENFSEAAIAFRVASSHRKSIKLTAISWLIRLAPQAFLKFYFSGRGG